MFYLMSDLRYVFEYQRCLDDGLFVNAELMIMFNISWKWIIHVAGCCQASEHYDGEEARTREIRIEGKIFNMQRINAILF